MAGCREGVRKALLTSEKSFNGDYLPPSGCGQVAGTTRSPCRRLHPIWPLGADQHLANTESPSGLRRHGAARQRLINHQPAVALRFILCERCSVTGLANTLVSFSTALPFSSASRWRRGREVTTECVQQRGKFLSTRKQRRGACRYWQVFGQARGAVSYSACQQCFPTWLMNVGKLSTGSASSLNLTHALPALGRRLAYIVSAPYQHCRERVVRVCWQLLDVRPAAATPYMSYHVESCSWLFCWLVFRSRKGSSPPVIIAFVVRWRNNQRH